MEEEAAGVPLGRVGEDTDEEIEILDFGNLGERRLGKLIDRRLHIQKMAVSWMSETIWRSGTKTVAEKWSTVRILSTSYL